MNVLQKVNGVCDIVCHCAARKHFNVDKSYNLHFFVFCFSLSPDLIPDEKLQKYVKEIADSIMEEMDDDGK